ncbi:MAG: BNR-4 repeat-containing protein [Bacteroidaceae bacterium]|nr:BNR-4 repeat-containing protein [Bacteroidaceae bacterium]
MKKTLILLTALLALAISAKAQQSYSGQQLTEEGAWCWFADPRAIHYTNADGSINASYIGYIDVHGNVKAMQLDHNTGLRTEVLVRSYFQPDDHNNPSFLVLPDERVLIIYSRHTDEPAFYYRVSKRPGDISALGEEKCIVTNHNTTYPSPFLMSDDPEHFYLCWRGLGWHPTIARLTLPDAEDNVQIAWGPYQMVQSTGARPYAKYYSNGKDKLYMTYTTGHPDNEWPNWLYFNVINLHAEKQPDGTVNVAPTLEDIKGNHLSVIADGKFRVNKSAEYKQTYPYTLVDAPTNSRAWVWQIACDTEGLPAIAMVRIDRSKNQHQYYYAKWTGEAWRLTDLANGGGRFHPSNTEYCYSGGEALDPANPNVIYLSIPTKDRSGKSIHEIWRYTLNHQGQVAMKEQITRNSEKNNVRPFVLPGSEHSPLRLLWMHGDYAYWIVKKGYPTGFPTAIHAHLPEQWAPCHEASKATKGAFTVDLHMELPADHYHGTMLTTQSFSYGLDKESVKPYVEMGGNRYYSTNQLYTSDNWATNCTGTHGDNWPTPHATLRITFTYDGNVLTVYRNGLIDQVIEARKLKASQAATGDIPFGSIEVQSYDRCLSQEEIQALNK